MANNLTKVGIALLFAIAFAISGSAIPIMYASHAPADRFIEVHDFEAQDVHPNAGSHHLCFDRDIKQGTSGTVDINLYQVDGPSGFSGYVDGGVSDASVTSRYFQEGHHKVIRQVPLPTNMDEGEYRYLLVIKLELANGDVTRQFTYRSETFNVSDDIENSTARRGFSCGEPGIATDAPNATATEIVLNETDA